MYFDMLLVSYGVLELLYIYIGKYSVRMYE